MLDHGRADDRRRRLRRGQHLFGRRVGRFLVPLRIGRRDGDQGDLDRHGLVQLHLRHGAERETTYAGFANGEGTGSLATVPTCLSTVSTTSVVGTHAGANNCSGGAAANYSFRYVPGDAMVTRATLTVTASSTSSTYGGSPTVTAGYSGFRNGEGPSSLGTLPMCSSAVTALSEVGTYAEANTCSGGAARNYSFSYVPADATVTKATLTVTASGTSSAFGSVPTVRPRYAGFRNGEGPGSLSTVPTCSSTVTAMTDVAIYGAPTLALAARRGTTRSAMCPVTRQ